MEVGGQRHAPAALPPGIPRFTLYRKLDKPQGRSELTCTTLNSCGHRGIRTCHNIRRVRIPLPFDPNWVLLCTDLNTPISAINHRDKETWLIMCFANWRRPVSRKLSVSRNVLYKFLDLFLTRNHTTCSFYANYFAHLIDMMINEIIQKIVKLSFKLPYMSY
jgi:hypothetical protein